MTVHYIVLGLQLFRSGNKQCSSWSRPNGQYLIYYAVKNQLRTRATAIRLSSRHPKASVCVPICELSQGFYRPRFINKIWSNSKRMRYHNLRNAAGLLLSSRDHLLECKISLRARLNPIIPRIFLRNRNIQLTRFSIRME